MDQLRRERDQLASTLATLTEETTKLRANAANFEGERNALQQKADAAAQQQKEALLAELAAANNKLKTTESDLARANTAASSHDATKQALDHLTEQVQKLSTDNQRLSAEAQANGSAAEKLAAAEKELSVLRSETSRLQNQLTESTAKAAVAASTTSELGSLKQANADLTSQVQKLTNDSQAIVQQATQGARQLKDSEQAIATAKAERDALAQQLASAKSAAQAPSAEVARLNAELSDAKSRLAASDEAINKANAERSQIAQQLATASAGVETVASAQQQVSRLTAELNDSKAKLTASEEALNKANTERTQLTAVVPTRPGVEEELAATKAKLQTAESALTSAEAERTDLAKRLASAAQNASAATTAGVAATVAAATPSSDDADLRKQLDESQLKLNSALRSYQLQQEEIDRLQKSITNIDAERAGLAERVQAATTQASVANAQAAVNNDANSQLAAIREQLRQTQNQVASLAGENLQLKNRIAQQGAGPASNLAAPTRPNVAQTSSGAAAAPARPGAATSASAPPATPPDRIYTVAAGDTLSKISKKYYGSSEHWNEILEANRDVIRDPRSLTLGSKLKIP
jgi:chromosome segregation ATPase